jgi:glycosyltransferase involved in cell wall biosynthesis
MRILVPAHLSVLRGGVGTLVRGVVKALGEAVTDPDELIVLTGPTGRFSQGAMRGLRGPAGGLARLMYEQVVAARLARSCDLVHLMDSRPLVLSGTPFLLTVHDVSYLDHPEWFPPTSARYKRAMLRRALAKGPAAIVCDSEHSRRRLLEHCPEAAASRPRVIYPGIAPPSKPPWGAQAVQGKRSYFLTVAVVEPRKNHLMLLEAFRHARAQGLDLDWKIVGEPGHLSEPILEALQRADGVQVHGRVSPADLEALYAGAQFMASPSLAEGFGFPPLEAMARGVPVICSRGSALDETAGEAAMQVDSRDVDGWRDALLTLAGSEGERERLREAGLARVVRFDWGATAEQLIQLYRDVESGAVHGS